MSILIAVVGMRPISRSAKRVGSDAPRFWYYLERMHPRIWGAREILSAQALFKRRRNRELPKEPDEGNGAVFILYYRCDT